MTKNTMLTVTALAAALSTVSFALADIVPKLPNLVPIASRMSTGTISVRNTGSAAAGAFKVTVECAVSCADPAPADAAPYTDAMFPNKITVAVPSLAAGHVYSHKIKFWKKLNWSAGKYQFTVVADAGGVVPETNEGDNSGTTPFVVP